MTEDMTLLEHVDRLHRIARQESAQRTGYVDGDVAAGLDNLRRDRQEVLEDGTPNCVHCGSPFTFVRSDGDLGCKDYHGIMPRRTEVDQ